MNDRGSLVLFWDITLSQFAGLICDISIAEYVFDMDFVV
jgi:hypothetical protein